MFHAESDGGLQILLAQWICCEKDDVTITSELTEAFYRDLQRMFIFFSSLFVSGSVCVCGICVCVCVSLSLSLLFLYIFSF